MFVTMSKNDRYAITNELLIIVCYDLLNVSVIVTDSGSLLILLQQ